ncbi:uncharacterized protein LOC122526187 isoform X3 [Polistes fuscatus]|uniref:uncharacterized protein LOC122526187 isoform X3 n=1 Tax=Polistes fuscatus TaxID=30207 RepID=UPI001CA96DAF|nr:uncharacterized protein LOC122526187 isoform X3 [Polistes fuscatus]
MNYIDLSKNLSAFVKACSNLGYLTAVNNAGRRVQRNRCSSLRSSAARGIARSATCCSLSITFPLPCTNHRETFLYYAWNVNSTNGDSPSGHGRQNEEEQGTPDRGQKEHQQQQQQHVEQLLRSTNCKRTILHASGNQE